MKIHFFQHVPFEGLGMIAEWAQQYNHSITSTAFYDSPTVLPEDMDYDALIIMGGPMGVYDELQYPWLVHEKRYIKAAIDAGKHVLGICLGAQLIASSLGASVAPHIHKEIGYFPVTLQQHPILTGLENPMMVLHWHGDRFEIPEGAQHLMSSTACDNQAFIYGKRVLGLQFHLEMDMPAVNAIIGACGHELVKGPWLQSADIIRQNASAIATRHALFTLLDNWIAT